MNEPFMFLALRPVLLRSSLFTPDEKHFMFSVGPFLKSVPRVKKYFLKSLSQIRKGKPMPQRESF